MNYKTQSEIDEELGKWENDIPVQTYILNLNLEKSNNGFESNVRNDFIIFI